METAPAPSRGMPAGLPSLVKSLLINLLGPYLIYRLTAPHYPPASTMPLLWSLLVPVGEFAFLFARKRMVDVISIMALVQLSVSIAITLLSSNAQLALDGHALMPAVLGLVFALSVWTGTPLVVPLARQMMAGEDTVRQAAFDARIQHPMARRAFARLTFAWGAAYVLQGLVLLAACNWLATANYLLVSQVISYGVLGGMIWGSIAYGRHMAHKAEQMRARQAVEE